MDRSKMRVREKLPRTGTNSFRRTSPRRMNCTITTEPARCKMDFWRTTKKTEPSRHASRPKALMIGCNDDQDLINACRSGETGAYGVLVQRYQDRLYPTV